MIHSFEIIEKLKTKVPNDSSFKDKKDILRRFSKAINFELSDLMSTAWDSTLDPLFLRLPYSTVYFEFSHTVDTLSVIYGCLCQEYSPKKDGTTNMHKPLYSLIAFSKKSDHWQIFTLKVIVGFSEDGQIEYEWEPFIDAFTVFDEDNSNNAYMVMFYFLKYLHILHVRTIELVDNKVSELITYKIKKSQQSLFTYKTLKINDSLVVNSESSYKIEDRNSPRVHLRKGHFRTSSSGRRYWVQPHSVGDSKKGMIVKDYKLD